MRLSIRELTLLGALFALVLFAFTPFARADEPGDPRVPAIYGTWTKTPTTPNETPNPQIQQYAPNSGAGIVIAIPRMDEGVMHQDWRALRLKRLAILADQIAMKINFDFDKSDLDTQAQSAVDELATLLQKNPDVGVSLAGHTDLVGTDDYNDALSQRRAEAVRAALYARGTNSNRMELSHFGKHKPIVVTTDRNRENRRVEIGIIDLYAQK